jgi:hypothetical protein
MMHAQTKLQVRPFLARKLDLFCGDQFLGDSLAISFHACAKAKCFAQRSGETNFRVRNCRIIHLKALDRLALLIVFLFWRRYPSLRLNQEDWHGQQAP